MRTRTILTILATVTSAISTAHAQQARQPGLLLRVYQIDTGVHYLPELAPGQLPNVVRVIPTLELRTDRGDFEPFNDQIVTEVTGYLNVEHAGLHVFRLISDDGSRLWIDDKLVVDHDGLHGAEPKDGRVELAGGEHALRVLHFESGGGEHLELRWQPPSAPEGKFELIPAELLTHAADASRETAPGTKRIIPPLRRGRPGDGTPVNGMHSGFEPLAEEEAQLARPGRFSPIHAASLQMINGKKMAVPPVVAWIPGTDEDYDVLIAEAPAPPYNHHVLVRGVRGAETKRHHLDDLPGLTQGCVFRFATGSDPSLLKPKRRKAFEMLAVRAMTNGFEIEFTKPLDPRCGWEAESYYVEQWPFNLKSEISDSTSEPEAQARGHQSEPGASATGQPPRRDGIRYPVKSASVSADRKRVFLEIDNLKESHVVYIRLLPPCISEDGELPWSTEAWYTLNVIPQDRYGKILTPPPPEPQNFLTEAERAAGWKLLFDGQATKGWHGYKKDYFPDGWIVKDGCLVRVGPGGDIATDGEFGNFELKLEWRVCAAGNSGIFYRVDEKYDWPFFTGPELQVLDNAEHADGRNPLTSAGSNYGLHAPMRDVTEPVGFFNQVRVVADGAHIEHWLNGVKIVEYELWSDEWKEMVANSKFKQWPNYGLTRKGHIVLQDHGDKVWYRNIKIRELGGE